MNLNLMGWFLKVTDIDVWLKISMLLMIETFYGVFLCAIIGLKSLVDIPAVSFLFLDWVSVAFNFFFWFLLFVFLCVILWFIETLVNKKERVKRRLKKSLSSSVSSELAVRAPTFYEYIQQLNDVTKRISKWCTQKIKTIQSLVQPDSSMKFFVGELKKTFLRAIDLESRYS